MENPETLAGAHIEAANVALHIFSAVWDSAGEMRGADNDHIAGHNGRGMKAHFSCNKIHLLVIIFFSNRPRRPRRSWVWDCQFWR